MFANLTEETATNNGVIFTLTGITDTSIPFGASFVDGQKVHYVAHGNNGKCAGIGTYNSGANTITQDDVWQWTPGGGVVEYPASNLTLAGAVVVYCDVFAVDNRLALFEEDDTDLALQAVKPTISLNFRDNKHSIYDGFANSYKEKILTDILTINNGAATGFDAIGLLRTSGVDSARLVFDPVTGKSLGLLHEPGATNLLLQSNAFDQSPWAAVGTQNLTKNALSIDGGINAWTFEDTDASLVSSRRQTVTIPNDSAFYCASVYCEAGATGLLYFRQAATGGTAVLNTAVFNITTRTWLSGFGGSYVDLRTGKLRVWVVIQNNSSGNTTFDYRVGATNTGNAEIGTVIFEKAQLNVGLLPSSYINTTVSSVARLVDKYFRTLSNEHNSREGTFVFEGILNELDGAASTLMSVSDGTNSNRITLSLNNAGRPQAFITAGGSASVSQTIDAGYVVGTPFIAAMSFKANSCILSFNGVSVEDTSVTIPSGLNQFAVGRLASGLTTQIYSGTIAETHYAPKAESAAVLNAITSGVLTYD